MMMTPRVRAFKILQKHTAIVENLSEPLFQSPDTVKDHSIIEVESIIETLERLPISYPVKWELMHFREVLTILRNL